MKSIAITAVSMLLLIGTICGQTIPTNALVTVSYDVEVTNYKNIPSGTDLALLTDFEKTTFKKRSHTKKVRKYLNDRNETTTVIEYGIREGYEGSTEGNVKKLVIDKNGVFKYDGANTLLGSIETSEKEVAFQNAVKANMSPEKFETIPDFTQLTPDKIQVLQTSGYQVVSTASKVSIKKPTEEFTYDLARKMLETRIIRDGKPLYIQQTYFVVNPAGKKTPALTLETTYETSENGVLIENVQVEKIKNFTRTTVNP